MTRSIVVITAGVSQPSSTRLLADQLAAAVTAAVGGRGEAATVEVIELRELAADLATTVTTGGLPTPAVAAARQRVSDADGIVAVTPVFASSYSGLFKMFVDVLDTDALNGMPVLIAATAGTARHSLMLDYAMRPLFTYLRAVVVPTGVFAATEDFGSAGLADRVQRAAAELAALVVAPSSAVGGFLQDGGIRHDGVRGAGSTARRRTSGNSLGAVTPFSELLAGHTGVHVERPGS